jgi:hypothetical protein
MPNMSMGGMMPNMSMGGMGNQGLLSTTGENLGGAIRNGINYIYNLIIELHNNGVLMYVILIGIGISIYYVLRYFIGLKLGSQQERNRTD